MIPCLNAIVTLPKATPRVKRRIPSLKELDRINAEKWEKATQILLKTNQAPDLE
jgi:hypothetical protein